VARGLAPVRLRSSRPSAQLGLSDAPELQYLGPLRSPTGRFGVPTSPLATRLVAGLVANRVQARTQGIGSDAWVLIVHPYRNPLPELQAADFLF